MGCKSGQCRATVINERPRRYIQAGNEKPGLCWALLLALTGRWLSTLGTQLAFFSLSNMLTPTLSQHTECWSNRNCSLDRLNLKIRYFLSPSICLLLKILIVYSLLMHKEISFSGPQESEMHNEFTRASVHLVYHSVSPCRPRWVFRNQAHAFPSPLLLLYPEWMEVVTGTLAGGCMAEEEPEPSECLGYIAFSVAVFCEPGFQWGKPGSEWMDEKKKYVDSSLVFMLF